MNIRRTPWTSDVRTVRRHQDVGVKRHAIAIDCKATGQVRRRGIEIWPRCFFRVRSSGDSISFALTLAIDEPTVRHAAWRAANRCSGRAPVGHNRLMFRRDPIDPARDWRARSHAPRRRRLHWVGAP